MLWTWRQVVREAKQSAKRCCDVDDPLPPSTPTYAASPDLGMEQDGYLAIMAALSSTSVLISRQEAMEACQMSTAGQDRLATLPVQPTQRRVPVADSTPAAAATICPPRTNDDDCTQMTRAQAFLYDPLAQPRIPIQAQGDLQGYTG